MNIRAVAEKAGVSITTVSRVLNHPEAVSKKTREHIVSVMKELNYTPNWFARNIQSSRTNVVGLILPDILDPASMETAKGVEDVAHQKGCNLMLCHSEFHPGKEREYVNTLLERKADGILLASSLLKCSELKELYNQHVPYVLLGKGSCERSQNMVYTDIAHAAFEGTGHLLKLGRKRIGLILSENPKVESEEKLEGYKRALESAGLPFSKELIAKGKNSIEGGFAAAGKLLDKGNPDGIFASTDQMAFGVMEKLKQLGKAIPEDVSLIGFDDLETGAVVEPKLTTITKPTYRMGLVAARLLFDMIEEGFDAADGQEILLQSKLKIRKSCGNKDRVREIW